MAGPGFFRGGGDNYQKPIIFQFCAENCMEMKEFGPQGDGERPWRPLRSAND